MGSGGGPIDDAVLGAVASHRTPGATWVATTVMEVGTTRTGLVVCGLAALALVVALRAYRPALAAVGALLTAALAAALLKQVFDRPRPPSGVALVLTAGPSFPSTQAAETAAIVVAVLVAGSWRTAWVGRAVVVTSLALLLLVGACMVYLGAHWTTDVLAGWLLGAGIGALIGWVARRRAVRA